MFKTVLFSTQFRALSGYMINGCLDVLNDAVRIGRFVVIINARSSNLYILCYGVSTIRGPRVKFLRECVDISM
uniref:Uncharacterized protein n=1 Tax=Eubacterium cellulosolvens (strain ATCC 43171 / JCM 9499 / 6) TaxID=633697 RepID=I5AQ40_EUBC6